EVYVESSHFRVLDLDRNLKSALSDISEAVPSIAQHSLTRNKIAGFGIKQNIQLYRLTLVHRSAVNLDVAIDDVIAACADAAAPLTLHLPDVCCEQDN